MVCYMYGAMPLFAMPCICQLEYEKQTSYIHGWGQFHFFNSIPIPLFSIPIPLLRISFNSNSNSGDFIKFQLQLQFRRFQIQPQFYKWPVEVFREIDYNYDSKVM